MANNNDLLAEDNWEDIRKFLIILIVIKMPKPLQIYSTSTEDSINIANLGCSVEGVVQQ